MKLRNSKHLRSILALIFLASCTGTAGSEPLGPSSGGDDPTVVDLPVIVEADPPSKPQEEENDEPLSFDASLRKEVITTASYLDEVPYLTTPTKVRGKKSLSIYYEEVPQDEEGYYDITDPLPKYYDVNDLGFVLSWYNSFDSRLDQAKQLKGRAFANCTSLNEWTNNYLMLFDVHSKKLDFCTKSTSRITSSNGTAWDCLTLYRGDIFKDDNEKVNYRYSECEVNLGITDCDPIYHQNNVIYLEDSYYICNQHNRTYSETTNLDGSISHTVSSENSITLYIDLKNPDLVYKLEYGISSNTNYIRISKEVFDLSERVSTIYSFSGTNLRYFDNDGHEAIMVNDGRATLNLYDFDGWDYFRVKSLDGSPTTDEVKFKLTSDNVNELDFETNIKLYTWGDYDWENNVERDRYCGYPKLLFNAADYESFESFLTLAGLTYKGEEDALSKVERYYDGEFDYSLFGERLGEISDEALIQYIQSVCDEYEYPEIEKILNLQAKPIPLGTSIIDQLFEVKGGVVFNEEKILLSELDVAVKDNPYLVPGQEYDCSIQLLDSDEYPIETIGKASFIYGTDEKLHFEDAALQELAAKISKGKYYLALDFNGYQTLLTFGGDKTKLDFEYHDHEWGVDEEGNYQITISDKTLSIHAKKGHQFLIKVKHEKEVVASDQIVVDEENHTLIYHCKECGETFVFEYTPDEGDSEIDDEGGQTE